jgi:hypothetical protein
VSRYTSTTTGTRAPHLLVTDAVRYVIVRQVLVDSAGLEVLTAVVARKLSLLPDSAGFALDLLLDPEDGGDIYKGQPVSRSQMEVKQL